MNRNSVGCKELAIHQYPEPQSASTANSRTWHRPIITVIDLKRTMLFGGPYFDGLASSA